jgi:hypothetical protein
MRSVRQRLQKLGANPPRRTVIWTAITIAIVACAWATIQRGPFDGLTLLAGFCGVLSLGLLLLPARPRLRVLLRTRTDVDTAVMIGQGRQVRLLDKEAIAEEQVNAALATLPPRPVPQLPPNSLLAKAYASFAASATLAGSFTVSEERRQEFEDEVAEYRQDLRTWLDDLERARHEHLRIFFGAARVQEGGEAPGDHVRLRLRFPPGFEPLADAPPWVPRPPERPHLRPPWSGLIDMPLLDRFPAPVFPRAPSGGTASYSRDGETTVVEFDLGRINQSDYRDTAKFELRAAPPGTHEIEWEVSASGLRKAARGRLRIDVAEPQAAEPIATLAEAEAERGRCELD